MKQAKDLWMKKRDAVIAVKKIPHYHRSIESTLLHGLAKTSEKDYWTAFKTLPRNLRTLYLHSYQSYMWNQLATFRIKEYGPNPIVGDLVYLNPEVADDTVELMETDDNSNDDDGKDKLRTALDLLSLIFNCNSFPNKLNYLYFLNLADKSRDKTEEVEASDKPEVKVLKEEDLPNYTIYDVLLPLEGTEVKWPENGVKKYFEHLLVENGMGLDSFESFTPR
jgi:tRNA pseudouridine13 synthase